MLQYSTYSVISPEGCASILWKSADNAPADLTFQQHVREVIASLNQRDTPLTLPLDIRGTAFQQQVW